MNYNETLEYIHSVSNFFCKPGLERIGELCEKIGNPQKRLKFIHVAGTNGKGSFCAMLASVLKSAGYKTGLYTSPYILEFNERIAVDGEMIQNSHLCKITECVKKAADTMTDKPTEFELITAVAFEYFKRQECDIVVLECGLGGRYDATNIISNSLLSVITGISIDHTSFLGDTIEQIAGEKAGIIKNNGLCLYCGDNDSAQKVILSEAERKDAKLYITDKSKLSVRSYNLSGTVFDYDELKDIRLKLLGSFQPLNAANVISAVHILNDSGFSVSENAIKQGISDTVWRARFEVICEEPLIIADGGHNPEGVNAAVNSIKLYFGERKVNIVTGVMRDKDYNYIADVISSVAANVFCVTPDNPRALSAREYSSVYSDLGVESYACESVTDAVRTAISSSDINSLPVVCLGSLYMYKEVLDAVNYVKKGKNK